MNDTGQAAQAIAFVAGCFGASIFGVILLLFGARSSKRGDYTNATVFRMVAIIFTALAAIGGSLTGQGEFVPNLELFGGVGIVVFFAFLAEYRQRRRMKRQPKPEGMASEEQYAASKLAMQQYDQRTLDVERQRQVKKAKRALMSMRLDSKVKRIGFVVMVVGLVLVAAGCWFIETGGGGLPGAFWASVLFDRNYYAETSRLVSYGFPLTIAGFLLSFAYDLGIGRIVRWIQSAP